MSLPLQQGLRALVGIIVSELEPLWRDDAMTRSGPDPPVVRPRDDLYRPLKQDHQVYAGLKSGRRVCQRSVQDPDRFSSR